MTQPTFAVVWTKMQVEFSNPTFDIVAIIQTGRNIEGFVGYKYPTYVFRRYLKI